MTKLHRRHSCQSYSSNSSSEEEETRSKTKISRNPSSRKQSLNRVRSCPESDVCPSQLETPKTHKSPNHVSLNIKTHSSTIPRLSTLQTATPPPTVKPPTQPKKVLLTEICWTIARLIFFTLLFIIGIFLARYFSTKTHISDEIENIRDQLQNQRKVVAELNSEIKTENIQDLEEYFESGDAMKPNLREKRHVVEFERQIEEINYQEMNFDSGDDSSLLRFDDNKFMRDGGREKNPQVSTLDETVTLPKQQTLECGYGQFRLEDRVESCRSWLSCKEIKNEVEFDRSMLLGRGMTKLAYLGKWRNRSVVVSIRNKQHRERFADFQNNIETLKKLQQPTKTRSDSRVVKLLGACDNKFLVTEYYQRGTLRDLLKSSEYAGYTLTARLKLVLEYVKAIEFLHTGSEHPRVYCDSNKLDGTTKQYLLTDDGRLVIGDLDDVPEVVAGEKIVCKHADFLYNRTDILKEGFLAPEQQIITSTTETVTSSEVPAKTDTTENKKNLSSHSPEKVSKLSTSFPKFDHRADIFKIADVAVHIITGGTYAKPDSVASGTNVQGVPSAEFLVRAKQLLYSENSELARIFALCRNRNPDRRPDVGLVKTALNRVVVLRVKRGLL